MSGRARTSRRHVVDLADPGEEAVDPRRAGAKAATLARLHRAGLRVPSGFVVAVAPAVEDGWRADAAAAYDALCARATPAGSDPAGASEDDAQNRVPVAVRSSSPYEDSPDRSAASLLPTRLGMSGRADVLAAVTQLRHPSSWEGLDRYVPGVFGFGGPGSADAPAILVQRLVAADVAGVAFTAHPVTGDRSRVLVEVGAGLGDVVTDGLLIPTLLELDRRSGAVVGGTPGRQGVMHAYDAAAGGLVTRSAGESPPTLSARESLAVWQAALAAEGVLGSPVDVEWALQRGSAEPMVWVLQARPITTLPVS